jgi:hypothetical protein
MYWYWTLLPSEAFAGGFLLWPWYTGTYRYQWSDVTSCALPFWLIIILGWLNWLYWLVIVVGCFWLLVLVPSRYQLSSCMGFMWFPCPVVPGSSLVVPNFSVSSWRDMIFDMLYPFPLFGILDQGLDYETNKCKDPNKIVMKMPLGRL